MKSNNFLLKIMVGFTFLIITLGCGPDQYKKSNGTSLEPERKRESVIPLKHLRATEKPLPQIDIAKELRKQQLFLEQGKYSEGLNYYLTMVEENPGYYAALYLYGNFQLCAGNNKFSEGDRKKGLKYIEAALELRPKNPYAYCGIGFYYEITKENEKAKTYYKMALKENPIFPKAQLGLAGIAVKEGRLEEALLFVKNVLKNHPKEITALQLLAKLNQKNKKTNPTLTPSPKVKEKPKEILDESVEKALATIENQKLPYSLRRVAAKNLLDLKSWNERIYQTVLKALSEDKDHGVGIFCVRGLSKHRGTEATVFELFLKKLKEKNHFLLRTSLAKYLGELRVKRAVPVIIQVMEEEENYFIDIANQALNKLTGENYYYKLSTSLSSKEEKKMCQLARSYWKEWLAENQEWISKYAKD